MTLTRTQTQALLDRYSLEPSRALGQNFLCEPSMIAKIVAISEIDGSSRVVEIGAGLGALTDALCRKAAQVVAIEVDRYVIPALREVVGAHERNGLLTILNDDAMKIDWAQVLGKPGIADEIRSKESSGAAGSDNQIEPDWQTEITQEAPQRFSAEWSVAANLPYNIATPLLLNLLETQPSIGAFTVLVQKEVGERLAANAGNKTYGIPSVLVRYWGTPTLAARVGPELFLPRPRVDSVIVRITRNEVASGRADYPTLKGLVKVAFGQRRKMLRKSLNGIVSSEAFESAHIEPTARPETLSIDDWNRLAKVLEPADEQPPAKRVPDKGRAVGTATHATSDEVAVSDTLDDSRGPVGEVFDE